MFEQVKNKNKKFGYSGLDGFGKILMSVIPEKLLDLITNATTKADAALTVSSDTRNVKIVGILTLTTEPNTFPTTTGTGGPIKANYAFRCSGPSGFISTLYVESSDLVIALQDNPGQDPEKWSSIKGITGGELQLSANRRSEIGSDGNPSTSEFLYPSIKAIAEQQEVIIDAETDNYTLSMSDWGKLIIFLSDDPCTLFFPSIDPAFPSLGIPVKYWVDVRQQGLGQITILEYVVNGGNVDIYSSTGSTKSRSQYSTIRVRKDDVELVNLTGDLEEISTPYTPVTISGNVTLDINYANKIIRVTSASVITIPNDVFLTNSSMTFIKKTSGAVTFVGGGTMTLNSAHDVYEIEKEHDQLTILIDTATSASILIGAVPTIPYFGYLNSDL